MGWHLEAVLQRRPPHREHAGSQKHAQSVDHLITFASRVQRGRDCVDPTHAFWKHPPLNHPGVSLFMARIRFGRGCTLRSRF
eukprot:2090892-Pyramimonas_sp.AAC.1